MNNETVILVICLSVLVVAEIGVYVAYNLSDEKNKESNGFPILAVLAFAWPLGVILAIPSFMVFAIGDCIIKIIRSIKGR